jgi:hypothetical protein
MRDLDVDGRVILQWISEKWAVELDRIHLVPATVQCQNDMNLKAIYGAGNLFISYGTISTIDSVQ